MHRINSFLSRNSWTMGGYLIKSDHSLKVFFTKNDTSHMPMPVYVSIHIESGLNENTTYLKKRENQKNHI